MVIAGDMFKVVHLRTYPLWATSGGGNWNWSMYGFRAGGMHPTGMLSYWFRRLCLDGVNFTAMLTILFLYLQLLYNEAGRPYAEGKGKNSPNLRVRPFWAIELISKPVADPRFPRRGHQPQRKAHQPIIRPSFPENCIKVTKTGMRGMPTPFKSANASTYEIAALTSAEPKIYSVTLTATLKFEFQNHSWCLVPPSVNTP